MIYNLSLKSLAIYIMIDIITSNDINCLGIVVN